MVQAVAENFPTAFVDRDSGAVTKFRTLRDRIEDDVLPNAAHIGLLAAKVALLAPFVGGLAVAAPVTAALWWGTRKLTQRDLNRRHDKLMAAHRKGEFSEYDLAKPEDRAAFDARFGARHPGLADDYVRMSELAQIKAPPKLLVVEPYFHKQGRSRFDSMISDFMAAAASRPDGKDPVVMLGRGALHDLTRDEMRAVIGHEFTHIRLGHMKETANWLGRFSLNSVINAALIGAVFTVGLPFAPVLGLIALTGAVGVGLKSIQSRRHEELCDRGAALLTGGGKDLTTALDKIKTVMLKIRQMEVDAKFQALGLDAPQVKEAKGITQFINATHPTNEKREKLLQAFDKKYPGYSDGRRSLFADAFGVAAKPLPKPEPAKTAPQPANKSENKAKPAPAEPEKPAAKKPKINYIRLPRWGFGY
jgi:Zn-dependent protease with chaperone function